MPFSSDEGVPTGAWQLKRELANRRRWATRADARRDLIRWIEGWFNTRRLHSAIDYLTLIEKEALYERTFPMLYSPTTKAG